MHHLEPQCKPFYANQFHSHLPFENFLSDRSLDLFSSSWNLHWEIILLLSCKLSPVFLNLISFFLYNILNYVVHYTKRLLKGLIFDHIALKKNKTKNTHHQNIRLYFTSLTFLLSIMLLVCI